MRDRSANGCCSHCNHPLISQGSGKFLNKQASTRLTRVSILGPTLAQRFRDHIDYYLIVAKFLGGEREGIAEQLKAKEALSPRDPWWIYKTARCSLPNPICMRLHWRDTVGWQLVPRGKRSVARLPSAKYCDTVLANKRDEAKQLSELITTPLHRTAGVLEGSNGSQVILGFVF